jgi:hypothetical protein
VSQSVNRGIGRRAFLATVTGSLTFPSFSRAQGAAPISDHRRWVLEQIERRACQFFYEQASPVTGLVRDRVRAEGPDDRRVASIASTGFGLSALCIADQRGFLPTEDARKRVEATLEFFARKAPHQQGFFYHFCDMETGARSGRSEISSIDTAWLLCGMLHARSHFNTPRVRRLTREIFDRVNWRWMLNGGETLSHGWTPESEFLPYRWDQYSELPAMYVLALGSRTHAIPISSWDSWQRPSRFNTGSTYIETPAPLFAHQYSHAWLDFRNRRDGYVDYFENSRHATLTHREQCIQLASRYPWFGPDMWGVTASDSRRGYVAWGGPANLGEIDGSLVPCAAGGSVVFAPEECLQVLETMLNRYGDSVMTRYGFVDAFHPGANWFAPDVIGIDIGIMMLMAEKFRTESVWRGVMAAPEIQRGLEMAVVLPNYAV